MSTPLADELLARIRAEDGRAAQFELASYIAAQLPDVQSAIFKERKRLGLELRFIEHMPVAHMAILVGVSRTRIFQILGTLGTREPDDRISA